jgi:hypothetical protein
MSRLMNLPRRFPYNPQWRIILFGLAFGGAMLAFGKAFCILFAPGIAFVISKTTTLRTIKTLLKPLYESAVLRSMPIRL